MMPMLLLRISESAPNAALYSMGMNTFLCNCTMRCFATVEVSFVVPFPAPIASVLKLRILSAMMENRLLFGRFLKESIASVCNNIAAVAAIPLHCLSKYMMTRKAPPASAPVSDAAVWTVRSRLKRQRMSVMVHLRPMRWLAPGPWTKSTIVFDIASGPAPVMVRNEAVVVTLTCAAVMS